MKEKQNEASNVIISTKFLVLHLLAFVILFLFLTPKVSARLFSFVSDSRLNTYLQETHLSEKIDARKYWEFREFYSPGSFHFSKTGLPHQTVSGVLNKAGLSLSSDFKLSPFLVFTSPKLESVDFLSERSTLEHIVPELKQNDGSIILKTTNEIMYHKDSSTIVMVFLKSPNEMRTANGFFDYRIADKELTKDKYWFNVTVITQ